MAPDGLDIATGKVMKAIDALKRKYHECRLQLAPDYIRVFYDVEDLTLFGSKIDKIEIANIFINVHGEVSLQLLKIKQYESVQNTIIENLLEQKLVIRDQKYVRKLGT